MPSRLLRTSTFRIALVYLVLLAVTLLALVGFVYWSTAGLVAQQTTETIQAEIRGLAEQYRTQGLPRLVGVIAERSGPNGDPAGVYLLADPRGRPLAGNLSVWPDVAADPDGWLEFSVLRQQDESVSPHTIRAHAFVLRGGFRLLVGRDTQERQDLRAIMWSALAWAILPALVLALGGGVLIGRYALRRVDEVREASQRIVGGDLKQRIPQSGSGDEFDRLAATINDMLAQIETLMIGMRAVTDSLAHDLRSPLTRAKGGIEAALDRDGDHREALRQVSAELDSILATFEALLNIARAESGVGRLDLQPTDLTAVAADLSEIYQPIAEEAGLELVADIAPGVMVKGHRELLSQALANLLDNAVKYTPLGGRIEVCVTPALLAVRDTGPGIPAADRARVLDRFVRLDVSRGTPGSGLGLSLVAAVARLHGARIVLSDAMPGLRVTLTFAS
ncbi:MAG: HAMP domain-containing sensor histidine kinase [Alphaproteobacteria bacterium]